MHEACISHEKGSVKVQKLISTSTYHILMSYRRSNVFRVCQQNSDESGARKSGFFGCFFFQILNARKEIMKCSKNFSGKWRKNLLELVQFNPLLHGTSEMRISGARPIIILSNNTLLSFAYVQTLQE